MGALATLLWLANVVLDTGGQLAFKAAASDPQDGEGLQRWKHMLSRPWLWIGIACYVLEFVAWIAFLSLVPLSKGVLLGNEEPEVSLPGEVVIGSGGFYDYENGE